MQMNNTISPNSRHDREMIQLYFAEGSCAFASIVALEEAGVHFVARKLDMKANEQRSAEYLAINPGGRVPTLIADGRVITETIALLTYVAYRFPDAGLLPLDHPGRLARAYELMSWFASSLHVTIAQIWRPTRFTQDATVIAALRAEGPAILLEGYREIERLMEGPWLLGETFSVLDPYAVVFWRWGERLGFEMHRFPAWAAHKARVMARPAAERAVAIERGLVSVSA
jgi:glutathione S-transferase